MNHILNDFTSLVRKGVDEYHMIEAGDRVAVGVSGGSCCARCTTCRNTTPSPLSCGR